MASTAVEQPTLVRNATARMQQQSGTVSKAIIDLRESIDRLIGSEPQNAEKSGGPSPVPSGDVQALHAEMDNHERTLVALAYQVNRLRSI